ncbi:type IV pilus modification protein PilV [Colwellia sp. MEBiC06753]
MRSKNHGMTFIEVLIALFILVTGILGAVAMQASAKKGSFDAMQRSLASSLAQDMIERMRNNQALAIANSYDGNDFGVTLDGLPANRCNSQANVCTPAEVATNDLYEWEMALMGANVTAGGKNQGGLLDARGCISTPGVDGAVTIVISWQGREETKDANKDACGTAGKSRRQFILEAFI